MYLECGGPRIVYGVVSTGLGACVRVITQPFRWVKKVVRMARSWPYGLSILEKHVPPYQTLISSTPAASVCEVLTPDTPLRRKADDRIFYA